MEGHEDNDENAGQGSPGEPGQPSHGATGGAGGKGGAGGRGVITGGAGGVGGPGGTAQDRRADAENELYESDGHSGLVTWTEKLGINARENWYRDIWLALLTALIGWILIFGIPNQITQNRQAICALRHDLERRVAAGEQFLVDHPKGAFGFTPAQIKKSVSDQKRTIQALRYVEC